MNRGGAIPRWLTEKLRAGVGARVGCFRNGDSGRGREGRDRLNCGLAARAPGPTDCENLGMAGVGGVYSDGLLAALYLAYDGVDGVPGRLSKLKAGEARLSARATGKKMPAPGIEVVK